MIKTVKGFQGQPGVTGTIASLAASGSTNVQFDLGPDWFQFSVVAIWLGAAGPSTTVTYSASGYSDEDATRRRLPQAFSTNTATAYYSAINPTAGSTCALVRPMGRYIEVAVTNNDATNALGAGSSIGFCAYPS